MKEKIEEINQNNQRVRDALAKIFSKEILTSIPVNDIDVNSTEIKTNIHHLTQEFAAVGGSILERLGQIKSKSEYLSTYNVALTKIGRNYIDIATFNKLELLSAMENPSEDVSRFIDTYYEEAQAQGFWGTQYNKGIAYLPYATKKLEVNVTLETHVTTKLKNFVKQKELLEAFYKSLDTYYITIVELYMLLTSVHETKLDKGLQVLDDYLSQLNSIISELNKLYDTERLEFLKQKNAVITGKSAKMILEEKSLTDGLSINDCMQQIDTNLQLLERLINNNQLSLDGHEYKQFLTAIKLKQASIKERVTQCTDAVNKIHKLSVIFKQRKTVEDLLDSLPEENDTCDDLLEAKEQILHYFKTNRNNPDVDSEKDEDIKSLKEEIIEKRNELEAQYILLNKSWITKTHEILRKRYENIKVNASKKERETLMFDISIFINDNSPFVEKEYNSSYFDYLKKVKGKLGKEFTDAFSKRQKLQTILESYFGKGQGISGLFGTYLDTREKEQWFWVKDFFRSSTEFSLSFFNYQSDWAVRKQYLNDLRDVIKEQATNTDNPPKFSDIIDYIEAEGLEKFKPRSFDGDEYNRSMHCVLTKLRDELKPIASLEYTIVEQIQLNQ